MYLPSFFIAIKSIISKNRLILFLPIGFFLAACTPDITPSAEPTNVPSTEIACHVTEPVWAIPPEDSAVLDPPAYGYYYLNEDRSIWASSWWKEDEALYMHAGGDGNKMGWFRPAGAELEITGERLDAEAPPLEAHVPCCYPTRFQATGLIFPTEGCWEVTAKAADKVISFIVKVLP